MEEQEKQYVCTECGYEGAQEDPCPDCGAAGSMVPADEVEEEMEDEMENEEMDEEEV
ncbi:hypothetical protein GTO10_05770 [Candidatus Saccharibacteria bacterium]|nr:hypothetical protein [Candidatus Saccharibacteria bacterium]